MASPRSTADQTNVTVLLSGGIDSSACIAFYLRQNFTVEGIHVNYGQPAAEKEWQSALAIADHYDIKLSRLEVIGARPKDAGLIVGRNAFLAFTALSETTGKIIAMGIHAGVSYFDCGPTFVEKIQDLFNCYTDGKVCIATPFLKWSKLQIWEFCKQANVPTELTYSCERSNQPCGHCASCKDLEALRG